MCVFYFISFQSISPTKLIPGFWNMVTLKTEAGSGNRSNTAKLQSSEKCVASQTFHTGHKSLPTQNTVQNPLSAKAGGSWHSKNPKQTLILSLWTVRKEGMERRWGLDQETPELSPPALDSGFFLAKTHHSPLTFPSGITFIYSGPDGVEGMFYSADFTDPGNRVSNLVRKVWLNQNPQWKPWNPFPVCWALCQRDFWRWKSLCKL